MNSLSLLDLVKLTAERKQKTEKRRKVKISKAQSIADDITEMERFDLKVKVLALAALNEEEDLSKTVEALGLDAEETDHVTGYDCTKPQTSMCAVYESRSESEWPVGHCVRVEPDAVLMPLHVFEDLELSALNSAFEHALTEPTPPWLKPRRMYLKHSNALVTVYPRSLSTYSDTAVVEVDRKELDQEGVKIVSWAPPKDEEYVVFADAYGGYPEKKIAYRLDQFHAAVRDGDAFEPGDSGTGCFNLQGKLVGILLGVQDNGKEKLAIISRPLGEDSSNLLTTSMNLFNLKFSSLFDNSTVTKFSKKKKAGKKIGSEFYEKAKLALRERYGREPTYTELYAEANKQQDFERHFLTVEEELYHADVYEDYDDDGYIGYEKKSWDEKSNRDSYYDDNYEDDFVAQEEYDSDPSDYDDALGMGEKEFLFGTSSKKSNNAYHAGPKYTKYGKKGKKKSGYTVEVPPTVISNNVELSAVEASVSLSSVEEEDVEEETNISALSVDEQKLLEMLMKKANLSTASKAEAAKSRAQKAVENMDALVAPLKAEVAGFKSRGVILEEAVILTAEEELKFPKIQHEHQLYLKMVRKLRQKEAFLNQRKAQREARQKEAARVQSVVAAKMKEIAELKAKLDELQREDF